MSPDEPCRVHHDRTRAERTAGCGKCLTNRLGPPAPDEVVELGADPPQHRPRMFNKHLPKSLVIRRILSAPPVWRFKGNTQLPDCKNDHVEFVDVLGPLREAEDVVALFPPDLGRSSAAESHQSIHPASAACAGRQAGSAWREAKWVLSRALPRRASAHCGYTACRRQPVGRSARSRGGLL